MRTVARSVARITLASATPGTLRSAFSTRFTHEAQVMPWTSRSITPAASRGRGRAAMSAACGEDRRVAGFLDGRREFLRRVAAFDAHPLRGEVHVHAAVGVH